MPKGDTMELRIFCICGQKMKVSESMYGRPGKCVACRQKIRIPRLDEIPEKTSELYLKDHPELLRKVPAPPASVEISTPPPEDPDELVLSDDGLAESTPALDILEPLRLLCSLDHKVSRKLSAAKENDPKGESQSARRLRAYQRRVERARMNLDEQLRQRLMEVAIELANTHDKIASAGLAVRVGETEFQPFRDRIEKLRRRREQMERLQLNLRGWLACRDPHAAGGYVDRPLDEAVGQDLRLNLPGDAETAQPLLHRHIEALRLGLFSRERADRKLMETDRLAAEGTVSPASLTEVRADCKAEKRRAEATVRFYRDRLEQLRQDYESDLQAVESQLELARGRLQVGELSRPQFEQLEAELLRAKTDLSKAGDLAGRALHANTVRDVPQAKGTFLARLTRPVVREEGIASDSWGIWSGALLLLVCTLLPALGSRSAVGLFREFGSVIPEVHWCLTLPVLAAVMAALLGLVPARDLRGLLATALGLAACIAGFAGLHETAYAVNPVGDALRHAGAWRPGIVAFFLAALTVAASGGVNLVRTTVNRRLLAGAVLATFLVLGTIHTDLWGYLQAAPKVSATVQPGADGGGAVTVSVSNAGHRSMTLFATPTTAPNTYVFGVESRVGRESWRPVPPKEAEAPQTIHRIAGGAHLEFAYALPPGDYRAVLTGQTPDHPSASTEFQVVAGPASDAPAGGPSAEAAPPDGSADLGVAAGAIGDRAPASLSMQLKGVVTGPDRKPLFAIVLYFPNGSQKELQASIGDVLNGPWKVKEFNPQENTVTVTDGDQLYILRREKTVALHTQN